MMPTSTLSRLTQIRTLEELTYSQKRYFDRFDDSSSTIYNDLMKMKWMNTKSKLAHCIRKMTPDFS